MSTTKKLASLLGAGVLLLTMTGTALAATGPSDQGVTPTEVQGNINPVGQGGDDADCSADDSVLTGDGSGSGQSVNGVTVDWTYDSATKAFSFTATGGVVDIAYIKGSSSYNVYDYLGDLGHGVDSDGNMFAPDNNNAPAGLSHAVFCTTPVEEETEEPSFESTEEGNTDAPSEPNTAALGGNGTSGPADGAWLLVVALGVLLASVVVMTPARAKSRR